MGEALWMIPVVATVVAAVAVVGANAEGAPVQGTPDALAAALANGYALLLDLQFERGSHRLDPSSGSLVLGLARAIGAAPGGYLLGARVAESPDGERNCALAAKRALAIKALLVLEGVSPQRVIAVGYGAARSDDRLAGDAGRCATTRIDVMRVR